MMIIKYQMYIQESALSLYTNNQNYVSVYILICEIINSFSITILQVITTSIDGWIINWRAGLFEVYDLHFNDQ